MERIVTDPLPRFAVTGLFSTGDAAATARDALAAAGLTPVIEATAPAARKRPAPPARERPPLVWRALWLGFWWSVAGAVIGVLVGLAFGLLGVSAPVIGTSIALEVASWAMFLHIAGALLGVYLALSGADAWGVDEDRDGEMPMIAVRVASDDRADTDAAQRMLWQHGAATVRQEHAQGENQTWSRARVR